MKKIMLIAAMMVAAMSVNAQNEVGQWTIMPKAGVNIASVTGDGDQKAKVGFVGGAELEYGIAKNFGLQFGALYSMEGCKEYGISVNLNYINIPILAQYYIIPGLAVKAGLQPAINVSSEMSAEGVSVKTKKLGAEANTFNLSIPVGVSYEYKSFVLDARYNIGVTKLYKNTDEGRNSTFSITVGYKFAL